MIIFCAQCCMTDISLGHILVVDIASCLCRIRQGVSQCPECERSNPSSQTHAPSPYPQQAPPRHQPTGPSQVSNPKPVAVRRTPRKRTLTMLDQDMVDTPAEARGHVRGGRETSRDDSSDAQEQETARFLNGQLACIPQCITIKHLGSLAMVNTMASLALVSGLIRVRPCCTTMLCLQIPGCPSLASIALHAAFGEQLPCCMMLAHAFMYSRQ